MAIVQQRNRSTLSKKRHLTLRHLEKSFISKMEIGWDYIWMTMSEVFLFLLSRLEQGDLLTRMKNKTRRLLMEIWGKVNWDKRWQGSIFNELANKCARNGPRHSIIESITWTAYSCAFKGCFCLRERNSNTFPYHTSFSSLRMYRNFLFCKYQKLRARDCIFKSKICSENNEKVARPILYYCCAHGLFKKSWQRLWFMGQFLSDMEYMFS